MSLCLVAFSVHFFPQCSATMDKRTSFFRPKSNLLHRTWSSLRLLTGVHVPFLACPSKERLCAKLPLILQRSRRNISKLSANGIRQFGKIRASVRPANRPRSSRIVLCHAGHRPSLPLRLCLHLASNPSADKGFSPSLRC